MWSWGVNDEGALGRFTTGKLWEQSGEGKGTLGDSYVPGRVELPQDAGRVVQLSAGDSHTALLTESGAVYICGTFRDSSGVMGFSPAERIALRPRLYFQLPANQGRICRIVSGTDHMLALTETGRVYSWGCGQQGQLGRLGERISDKLRLSAQLTPAEVHIPRRKGPGGKLVDVACGSYHSFFLTADGAVYTCGLNNYGQLGMEGEHERRARTGPTSRMLMCLSVGLSVARRRIYRPGPDPGQGPAPHPGDQGWTAPLGCDNKGRSGPGLWSPHLWRARPGRCRHPV